MCGYCSQIPTRTTMDDKQAVRVATQYAYAKLTVSSHLFAMWRCCSGITISSYLFARWHLFQHVSYLRHQQQVDLWPLDLEVVSESHGVPAPTNNSSYIGRVISFYFVFVFVLYMWLGYLYANFSLPRPICSRDRPDVRDRHQTDRQTSDRCQTKGSLVSLFNRQTLQ